ncbi:death-inducer obliterator 1-like [Cucurbita maxima]|uniref:Death-inducer obliterator 1-like n=1 Tax=Cucurbita maxima TaxID=3661 RepID=A0A6J1IMJ5_CUCMA|nr:death-inducer obliterator 1-like [Cucurbita maxima]XP_022976090.1 death-inducer obliterator 1-like [Cucurbita maxima]
MQSRQLDPISNKMESSLSEAQRGVVVSSNDSSLHQYLVPNRQMELMGSIAGGSLAQSGMVSCMQTGHIDVKAGNFGQQQFQLPSNPFGGTGSMLRTAEGVLSLPMKRKASIESFNPLSQQSPLHNKRVASMEHRPWLHQTSGIARRPPLQIPNNAPVSMHSPAGIKRKVQQMESHPTKVRHQRPTASKGQSAPLAPTSKIQNEPTGSVRSKMRESLTAALALVTQQQDKLPNDEKSSLTEAEKSAVPEQENSVFSGPAIGHVSDDSKKLFSEKLDSVGLEDNVGKMLDKSSLCVNVSDLEPLRYDGRVFQQNNVLSYEDISFGDNFFIKDDLLQENGLSWVLEADLGVTDKKEMRTDELQKMDVGVANKNQGEKPVQTPEALALKIEEELFKLFGGVNKKYKEKGRSLLFNLKDRNNPELRERVMSGEITPERLCSMTAEELASKELSEWRMAKAEELAQMVVLPDSEVDIRRLVKKTHKGEFQVEVEQYDNASADVSSGASAFSQSQLNKNETDGGSSDESEAIKDEQNIPGQKNGASDKDNYTFTIPSNEGADLMQGLMVDDGLKYTESLPPIVSLDEFMESLDTEPPFDILAEDAGKLSPILEKGEPEPSSWSKSAAHSTKGATDVSIDKNKNNEESNTKADIGSSSAVQMDLKSKHSKADVDSNDNQAGSETSDRNDGAKSTSDSTAKSGTESLSSTFKLEHLWDGILQYNISTMTPVVGTYISGERTSAKDWPGILEVKGRVRLDAFEKFLQELPLSRSRAVMVLHLDLKEGRPDSDRANLREVAESYVADERVGIAEPGSGVEFYFCPPHGRILEMLCRILLRENNEALNAIKNGLIGVVVWRKTQLTSMSPNSTSHHKRSSKKQHFSSRRQQESSNLKANNISPKQTITHGYFPAAGARPLPEEEDADGDDDVPPGFGPSTARDDDDLPEFNFSGSANPSVFSSQTNTPTTTRGLQRHPSFRPASSQTGSRPVEQMRELVQKYGQNLSNSPSTGNWGERSLSSVAMQPWNDDDDDIPEWQPQAAASQQLPVRGFHQPTLRAHYMVNQQQPVGAPAPLSVSQQGTWWGPQQGHNNSNNIQPAGNLGGSHSSSGQFYGAFGRSAPSNPSNNRGF